MIGEKIERAETDEVDFVTISHEIAGTDVTVYERLNPTNSQAAKEEFLADPNLTRPNYEYGNLDETEVGRNLEELKRIDYEIQSVDWPSGQKLTLGVLADDNRRKNEFLAANIAYNQATDPEEKAALAERHHEANEALYGKADEDTFYALLREKISGINYESLSDENKKIYDQLMEEIGPMPETAVERFRPKPETVERFGELVNYFFEGFLMHVPDDKKSFTSEEMVGMINEIIDEEFDDETIPYHAELKTTATNASANHEERRLYFPEGETYTAARAKALIVHELGTHVMRAIPYIGNNLVNLSKSMPGGEEFDEGIAKSVEQAINGKYEDSGIDHYLNIGLATFKGKNFREVYDIQCKLKQLTGSKTDKVFNAVQRCFRGTGELVNNKDLVYYNGANNVWKYIEEHIDDPELFDHLFLTGKTNYEDPDQERLIYEARTKGI